MRIVSDDLLKRMLAADANVITGLEKRTQQYWKVSRLSSADPSVWQSISCGDAIIELRAIVDNLLPGRRVRQKAEVLLDSIVMGQPSFTGRLRTND